MKPTGFLLIEFLCVIIAAGISVAMLMSKRIRRVGLLFLLVPIGIIGGAEIGYTTAIWALSPSGPATPEALGKMRDVLNMSFYLGDVGGGALGAAVGFGVGWLSSIRPRRGPLRRMLIGAMSVLALVALTWIIGLTGAFVGSAATNLSTGWDGWTLASTLGLWTIVGVVIAVFVSAYYLAEKSAGGPKS